MTRQMLLGVNIDHIATLRQQRMGILPDPVAYACLAEAQGADHIVCHLREDRRHIQESDVLRLRESVRFLNLEFAVSSDVMSAVRLFQPDRVTLVPEHRQELTTESGVDVQQAYPVLAALVDQGLAPRLSVFVDPELAHIDQLLALGISMIELSTAAYAQASEGIGDVSRERARLMTAAQYAYDRGMRVAAGHGLDMTNLAPICALYPMIEECNIGFSLVVTALSIGWAAAIEQVKMRLLDASICAEDC